MSLIVDVAKMSNRFFIFLFFFPQSQELILNPPAESSCAPVDLNSRQVSLPGFSGLVGVGDFVQRARCSVEQGNLAFSPQHSGDGHLMD